MATTSTRSSVYTFEDFCWIVRDGQKADLIDGVIYMASPDNIRADELFGWLRTVWSIYVRRMDLGRIVGSRVAFRLSNRNGPEPDIGFVRKERRGRIKSGHVAGPPNLALEIVSPDSVERDYVRKRGQYEAAGVQEYWIVDPLEERVTLLRLDSSGKYREVRAVKGKLESQVVKGLWLKIDWLWQHPLPDEIDTVFQIMEGG
jgi:Uma2 family endonuclease